MRVSSSWPTIVVPDSIDVRALLWPSDLPQLERLNIAFSTDVVCEVQSAPHGFLLVERAISPSLRKQYRVDWNQLVMSSAAIVAVLPPTFRRRSSRECCPPRSWKWWNGVSSAL